jgi:Mn-dependent DtxR family transcriptional regulator
MQLSLTAFRTYLALISSCADSNSCHAFQTRLSEKFKLSLSSVNRAIGELKKAGMLLMERGKKTFNSSKYTLLNIVTSKAKEILNRIKLEKLLKNKKDSTEGTKNWEKTNQANIKRLEEESKKPAYYREILDEEETVYNFDNGITALLAEY